ncbi:MAG: hypothetical protein ACLFWB_00185 [Armatimonadota bacterium]
MANGHQSLPLQLFIVAVGLASGLVQVVLVRQLLIVCSGSELAVGVILGIWLLAGAAGSWWGGRRARRDTSLSPTVARVPFLAAVCTAMGLAAICLVRLSPDLFGKFPEPLFVMPGEMFGLLHVLILCIASVAPVAFAAEAQFGTAVSIYGRMQEGPDPVARSYAMDAIGHLIGGGAAAYVLTLWLDPLTATFCAGSIALMAGMAVAASRFGASRMKPQIIALTAAVILGIPLMLALHTLTLQLRWSGYDLMASIDTLHSNVVVAEHGVKGRVFFINGQPSGYTETMPDTHLLVHFAMLQHPDPQNVLLIGGRGTGALEEVATHPVSRVDYFELDPGLVDIYDRFRRPLVDRPEAAITVHRQDLRAYLRSAPDGERRWDVAIFALPPPLTAVLNRHYTRECLRDIAQQSPEIIFAFGLPGTQTYYSQDMLNLDTSILYTAAAGKRKVVIMPGYSLFAAVGPDTGYMSEDASTMLQRLEERGVAASYWTSVISDHLDPMNVDYVHRELQRIQSPPINTDLQPIAYYLNQIYALRQFDAPGARVLAGLKQIALPAIIRWFVLIALVVMCVVAWLRKADVVAVPTAIAGTGFVAMVLQLAVLYAFQIQVGYVYSLIGVLTGAFMVGLAAGGLFAGRLLRHTTEPQQALLKLLGALIALGLFSLVVPALITGLTGVSAHLPGWFLAAGFFLLSFVLGGMVGVQFPLATEIQAQTEHRGFAAASMYAADLLGGSSGAVLAGAVLVPLYGIGGASLLCAVIAFVLVAMCALQGCQR